MAEWLMQRFVKSCFGVVGSNPINPIIRLMLIIQGRSIIGNAFDLGSKDCRFESCRPEFIMSSIMAVWGFAKP